MTAIKEEVCVKLDKTPVLSPGDIHIWQVSTIISSAKFAEYKSLLTDAELEKAHFFESKHTMDSYVVSQGALRMLLSNYLGVSSDLVRFGHRNKGKPFSLNNTGLYFNLSNSGRYVVIGFSLDSELGVDIEQIRPLPDLEEMIGTNFTANEIKFINSKPEERLTRFFRFWTVKESYLKAIGEGMRLAPKNLEFSINNNDVKQLSVKGVPEQDDWKFKEFSISKDYVGTITYYMNNVKFKFMKL